MEDKDSTFDQASALSLGQGAATQMQRGIQAHYATPHLFLWGGVWIAANSLGVFFTTHSGWIWLALSIVGVAGSVALVRRHLESGPLRGSAVSSMPRFLSELGIVATLLAATLVWAWRTPSFEAINLTISLVALGAVSVIALRYADWALLRVAIVVAGLSLIGAFVFDGDAFRWWMALAGGGGLILGGSWMKWRTRPHG